MPDDHNVSARLEAIEDALLVLLNKLSGEAGSGHIEEARKDGSPPHA